MYNGVIVVVLKCSVEVVPDVVDLAVEYLDNEVGLAVVIELTAVDRLVVSSSPRSVRLLGN